MTIEVLLPVSPRGRRAELVVEWRARSTRPTVALVDNTMPLAGQLLAAVGRHIVGSGDASDYFLATKPAPGRGLPEGEWADVLNRANVLVAGVGVCGACTSGSVRDGALALEYGIPAVVLVTKPFLQLAELTRTHLGAPGVRLIALEHPLWTRDEAWIDAAGRDVALAVAEMVAGVPALP